MWTLILRWYILEALPRALWVIGHSPHLLNFTTWTLILFFGKLGMILLGWYFWKSPEKGKLWYFHPALGQRVENPVPSAVAPTKNNMWNFSKSLRSFCDVAALENLPRCLQNKWRVMKPQFPRLPGNRKQNDTIRLFWCTRQHQNLKHWSQGESIVGFSR